MQNLKLPYGRAESCRWRQYHTYRTVPRHISPSSSCCLTLLHWNHPGASWEEVVWGHSVVRQNPGHSLKKKDYVWHKRCMLTRVETKLIWNIHRINIFNQYLTCKHLPDSNHDQNTTRDNRCQGKHCPAPTHCLGASYSAVSILSVWLEICKMGY